MTDAQDGTPSVSPTLSAVTGPLAGFGLGTQTATCSYTDAGGLAATANATYTIVDTGKPVIELESRTPAANDSGWNNTAVTVTWSCTDTGTGVVADTVTATVQGEGADQSATGTCTDRAGNTASATENGQHRQDDADDHLRVADSRAVRAGARHPSSSRGRAPTLPVARASCPRR